MTPFRLAEHLNSIMFHPLSRDRPLKALERYIRWQIGCRLVPGPVIIALTDRGRLVVRPGMTGATCNIYTGLHDFPEMSFTVHLLRPGDVFGDVGANVGVYTVLAGAVAGARCIAYEPSETTSLHLSENIIVNQIDAKLIKAAVGRKPGNLRFTVNYDTMNHVALADEAAVEVQVVTLDETCPEATLLKIDVEGFEHEVLAGAQKLLANPSLLAVIMETNESGARYGSGNDGLLSTMMAHGFEVCSYDPFTRTLAPGRPERNVILVRDRSRVAKRLQTSPAFKVFGRSI